MATQANSEAQPNLTPNANWQTRQRGTNSNEYDIYVACAEDLGWEVKSYEEWLHS